MFQPQKPRRIHERRQDLRRRSRTNARTRAWLPRKDAFPARAQIRTALNGRARRNANVVSGMRRPSGSVQIPWPREYPCEDAPRASRRGPGSVSSLHLARRVRAKIHLLLRLRRPPPPRLRRPASRPSSPLRPRGKRGPRMSAARPRRHLRIYTPLWRTWPVAGGSPDDDRLLGPWAVSGKLAGSGSRRSR
jgi:hypothetical protein